MADLGSPTMNCFRNGTVIQLRSKLAEQNRCLRVLGNHLIDCYGRPGYYAGDIVPRTRVCARWSNGLYYKGTVSRVEEKTVHIDFDNGNLITHLKSDVTAVVLDIDVDNTMTIQCGSHIIGLKNGKSLCYHPGIVYDIDRTNKSNYIYKVFFYDNGTGDLSRSDFRPLPTELPRHSMAWTLIPGCPAFAKKHDEKFHRGIIHHVDSKIHVEFEDGDFVEHGRGHNHTVIPDVVPSQEKITIGKNVIARFPGHLYYLPGQVVNIDDGDPHDLKFFIQFENLDERAWVFAHQLRTYYPTKDQVGTSVFALMRSGQYLPGTVSLVTGETIQVQANDGNVVEHEIDNNEGVILDVLPLPHQLKSGSRVIAFSPSCKAFIQGTVQEMNFSNPLNITCYVDCGKGFKGWSPLKNIRIIPPLCKLRPGSKVICRWQPEYVKHFPGTVTAIDHKVHVRLDDGRTMSHDYSDVSAVFPDYVPQVSQVHIHSYVVARVPKKPFYQWGFVKNIDGSNPTKPKFYVKYEDAPTQRWCELDELRLMSSFTPQFESQFVVKHLGGHLIALNSMVNKVLYVGIEGGVLKAKPFDPSCQFFLEETSDHYVKFQSAAQCGCYIISNVEGKTSIVQGNAGYGVLFEVKLLFSPYQQVYIPNHTPSPVVPPASWTGMGHPSAQPPGHPQMYPGLPQGGYPTQPMYPPGEIHTAQPYPMQPYYAGNVYYQHHIQSGAPPAYNNHAPPPPYAPTPSYQESSKKPNSF